MQGPPGVLPDGMDGAQVKGWTSRVGLRAGSESHGECGGLRFHGLRYASPWNDRRGCAVSAEHRIDSFWPYLFLFQEKGRVAPQGPAGRYGLGVDAHDSL